MGLYAYAGLAAEQQTVDHCARLDGDVLVTVEEDRRGDSVAGVNSVTDVSKTIHSTVIDIIVESMALRLPRFLQLFRERDWDGRIDRERSIRSDMRGIMI